MERTEGSFIYQDFSDAEPAADYWRRVAEEQKDRQKWKEVTRMAFEAVDPNELQEVLASSRERGVYEREANEFLATGEQAGKVSLTEGAFAGKKASSVLQGFRNIAKSKFEDSLRVIGNAEEGTVYLINTQVS